MIKTILQNEAGGLMFKGRNEIYKKIADLLSTFEIDELRDIQNVKNFDESVSSMVGSEENEIEKENTVINAYYSVLEREIIEKYIIMEMIKNQTKKLKKI